MPLKTQFGKLEVMENVSEVSSFHVMLDHNHRLPTEDESTFFQEIHKQCVEKKLEPTEIRHVRDSEAPYYVFEVSHASKNELTKIVTQIAEDILKDTKENPDYTNLANAYKYDRQKDKGPTRF